MENGYFKLTHYLPDGKLNDEKATRVKHLVLFKFFIENLIEGLEALYLNKDYQKFDPHVGDTLCQIRAMHLLELARRKNGSYKTYLRYLQRFLSHLEQVLTDYTESSQKKYLRHSLSSFLKQENLILELPDLYDYLLKSYLLTKYVSVMPDEEKKSFTVLTVDRDQLATAMQSSRKSVNKIVMHWQRSMTEYSVNYLRNISSDDLLTKILTEKDSLGRLVLPTYYAMDLIIKRSKKVNAGVLLLIYHPDKFIPPLVVSFRYNHQSQKHVIELEPNKEEVYLSITAVSNRISENAADNILLLQDLKQYGIVDLLMFWSAQHIQFSCPSIQQKQGQDGLTVGNKKSTYTQLHDLNACYKSDKATTFKNSTIEKYLYPRVQHVSMGTLESTVALFAHYVAWYDKSYMLGGPLLTERHMTLNFAAA